MSCIEEHPYSWLFLALISEWTWEELESFVSCNLNTVVKYPTAISEETKARWRQSCTNYLEAERIIALVKNEIVNWNCA